jgi:heme/copper-type cytochrome/quinol oxidase subunit 3
MSWLSMVGYGAGGFLILSWLAISFMAPSSRRSVVEWFSATSMYLLLVSLFVHMAGRALESGNNVALIGFGFLCVLFGAGLVVSTFHAFTEMGGKTEARQSATN